VGEPLVTQVRGAWWPVHLRRATDIRLGGSREGTNAGTRGGTRGENEDAEDNGARIREPWHLPMMLTGTGRCPEEPLKRSE
jgi:hypothetical protein